jgi:hypothetical protein
MRLYQEKCEERGAEPRPLHTTQPPGDEAIVAMDIL